ncbi:hypothetical protein [Pseudomonas sp.]|uniref:hypothetical protein n=1 Tax=Pseudomonas sp. TaxID=306 RepID=UPI0026306D2F|nr:hypothetical protein [Pseudomonas sp.]
MSKNGQLCLIAWTVGAFIQVAIADTVSDPSGRVDVNPVQAPPITTDLASTTMVEVWNQSDFQVYATQQGKKLVLEPNGRVRLDNRNPVTVSAVSPNDALRSASLVGTNTKCQTQYCLIVQGIQNK